MSNYKNRLDIIFEANAPSAQQSQADKEANQERQEQIQKVLQNAQQVWNTSNIAKIIVDPNKAFNTLLKIAKNEKTLAYEDANLIREIIESTVINPNIADLFDDSSNSTFGKMWAASILNSLETTKTQFEKLQLEGIMGTIGGLFVKLVKFLIKTTAAGLAAGATLGASLVSKGGAYGGGYGRGSRSKSGKLTGNIEDKYKIALRNAAFIDAYIAELDKEAAIIYEDPQVQEALGSNP